MFKNLKNKSLKQRLNFGYRVVIVFMLVSGIVSVSMLGVLYANVMNYINGPQAVDSAVKVCRININVAARNIREMVINDDTSTYESYKATVQDCMDEIATELDIIKETDIIDTQLYNQFETMLNEWGTVGYSIMEDIAAGDRDGAEKRILTECAPILDEVVTLARQFDAITDEAKDSMLGSILALFVTIIVVIAALIVIAVILAMRIGKIIVTSVTEPLYQVETVANELSAGNLHSTLEYHSEDEIGRLAHSLRKSIRILGSYVDDIARSMNEFSKGNFDVQPEVEWKGDFVGILNSFMEFESNMADTVKGIQRVADQVKGGADQVSASSMDLAEGATEQAGVVEELTATITEISDQVTGNAKDARKISHKVKEVGEEILISNNKMNEMVQSMTEIDNASQEISKIIATINDIASQTNLLALNASIEAARVGEAGKGFAVVADQVSLLAAQSAEAAKESAVLIETSVKAVEKGMVIANETAHQLEQVVKGSEEITREVDGVAEALELQNESFRQINDGVGNINDVVQTNSATSEECAAASQEMTSQAANLDGLIRRFKVAHFKN